MTRSVKVALRLWPAVLGMLIVIAVNRIEQQLFPVVTNFTIKELTYQNNTVLLSGYMRKDRNCAFAGVSAKAKDKEGNLVGIPLIFKDTPQDHTSTRPTGTQGWGPWSLQIPLAPSISEVTLSSAHHCHIFWASSTRLITFPILQGQL